MGLDIRWPIGLLFTLLGAVLIGYGSISDPSIYEKSLGINVNVEWGGCLLVFGVVMTGLARRGSRKKK